MDNISEQLVKIQKKPKDYILMGGIWFLAFILVFVLVLACLNFASLLGIVVVLIAAVIFGAYKLSAMLNVEYEYIVVNHDMDVDKIVAQSNRKRIVSIKLNEVQECGYYTKEKIAALEHRNFDQKFICCDPDDESYYLIYKHPKKGLVLLVIAMNERTKEEAFKSIPRISVVK